MMDTCLLCLELNKDILKVIKADSTKWQELNIKQVVENHFWPLNAVQNSSCLWITCWAEVNEFHKFYKWCRGVPWEF
ncbi:hypothetical protein DOY81_014108 [Sarcophaga bullata]|nr:hypothetical protein DOY81_014108 [Sarcophaga bullata]